MAGSCGGCQEQESSWAVDCMVWKAGKKTRPAIISIAPTADAGCLAAKRSGITSWTSTAWFPALIEMTMKWFSWDARQDCVRYQMMFFSCKYIDMFSSMGGICAYLEVHQPETSCTENNGIVIMSPKWSVYERFTVIWYTYIWLKHMVNV